MPHTPGHITTRAGVRSDLPRGSRFLVPGGSQLAEPKTPREEALERILGIPLPELQELVPEQQDPSAIAGFETDPRFAGSQFAALERLQELSAPGLSRGERGALQLAGQEAALQAGGARQAALQRLGERGIRGGGLEISALQGGQQVLANAAQRSALGVSAQAGERALSAASRLGTLATTGRAGAFDEESRRAAAIDAINRFNVQQRAVANRFNVDIPQRGFENIITQQRLAAGELGTFASAEERAAADKRRQDQIERNEKIRIALEVARTASRFIPQSPGSQFTGGPDPRLGSDRPNVNPRIEVIPRNEFSTS